MGIINNKYFILFVLWLCLTIVNLNKAIHIDDTFHLEASQLISMHPDKPMTGLINWGNDPTPMYEHNQPPLFFYFIALVSLLFGNSEVALHLFLSLFTFLALIFFQKLSLYFTKANSSVLLILFSFCPAFVVNQNIMTDVPILALVLGTLYFLLKAKNSQKLIYYSLSCMLLGISLLIKYSALPLLVVITIVIIVNRDYRNLLSLLIPITMLLVWTLWNQIEYDGSHILGRSKTELHFTSAFSFMACLGAMSSFSLLLLYGIFPFKKIQRIICLLVVLSFFLIFLFYNIDIDESLYSKFLNFLFFLNGLLIAGILSVVLFKKWKNKIVSFLISDDIVVWLFLVSLSAFIILFAPFTATRHILIIIPFCLLLGNDLIKRAPYSLKILSIGITVFIGIGLGISDWKYADYYRKMAGSIDLPKDEKVWTSGHWGWQWYSLKRGIEQYSTNQSIVNEGDYFVYPGNIARQELNENIKLVVVDKKWEEASILTFISGNNYASMYNSTFDRPPWSFSKNPIDTIYVCKIELTK